jgi:hypothetical protein
MYDGHIMAKTIAALFRTQLEGEAAYNKLLSSGFTRDQVSFVAGHPRELSAEGTAYLTDAIGVAVEAMALLVPGSGPLVAAGPLAGVISRIGSEHGGIAGVLQDHGVPEEKAGYYAERVRTGGSLVTVHDVTGDAENRALSILELSGAIKSDELAAEGSGLPVIEEYKASPATEEAARSTPESSPPPGGPPK